MKMVFCGIYSCMNALLLDIGKTVFCNYKVSKCYRLAIRYASDTLYTVIIFHVEIIL